MKRKFRKINYFREISSSLKSLSSENPPKRTYIVRYRSAYRATVKEKISLTSFVFPGSFPVSIDEELSVDSHMPPKKPPVKPTTSSTSGTSGVGMSSTSSSPSGTLPLMSVAASLDQLSFSPALQSLIKGAEGTWDSFGKKDSHILRRKLFHLFAASKMSPEAMFMVYFFHAAIKDRDRILVAMALLGGEFQTQDWYSQVWDFISMKMVKLVKSETTSNFASVHLPNTNPGLDILCALFQEATPKSEAELLAICERIIARTTFAQMRIDEDLQDRNKVAVENFWDHVVVLRDRQERIKAKAPHGFVPAFYATQARDTYEFVNASLKEISPREFDFETLKMYVGTIKGVYNPKDGFHYDTSESGGAPIQAEGVQF